MLHSFTFSNNIFQSHFIQLGKGDFEKKRRKKIKKKGRKGRRIR